MQWNGKSWSEKAHNNELYRFFPKRVYLFALEEEWKSTRMSHSDKVKQKETWNKSVNELPLMRLDDWSKVKGI